jgi:hypothetical protein
VRLKRQEGETHTGIVFTGEEDAGGVTGAVAGVNSTTYLLGATPDELGEMTSVLLYPN